MGRGAFGATRAVVGATCCAGRHAYFFLDWCDPLCPRTIRNRENFFRGKELCLKNLNFDKRCKNDIDDNNDKICSRFIDTVSYEIEFTA